MLRWAIAAVLLVMMPGIGEAQIPAEYHGRWGTADQCAGQAEEPATIGAAQIDFHESTCRVVSVRPANPGIRVQLRCTGEGERWNDTRRFRIVDRTRLRMDDINFVRCGATRSEPRVQPGRWLVVASRSDRHEAIGIARLFPAAEARVFRSRNGVFAVRSAHSRAMPASAAAASSSRVSRSCRTPSFHGARR